LRLALICFDFTVLAVCGSLLAAAQSTCQFNSAGGKIQHVIYIYIQFDNTHLRRDNPNVPSGLEQMPHLLNFLRSQGSLNPNHHAVLISHTANDILTSLTGVYSAATEFRWPTVTSYSNQTERRHSRRPSSIGPIW
jgi:hypothetical protein